MSRKKKNKKKDNRPVEEQKYDFNATSMTSTTTPLRMLEDGGTPQVWYTHKAWNKIVHVVAVCPKEVGWFGTVEEVVGGYLITDIFVPKQTVTGTQTDILPEDLGELAMIVDDPEKLYYWGHSHVNMQVRPSGQDETQTQEYLNHTDVFIRGIYNKAGVSKVDVFDTTSRCVYECVKNTPLIEGLTHQELTELNATIKDNVKEKVYPVQTNYNQGNFNQGNRRQNHNQQGNVTNLNTKKNPFLLENFM